MREQKITNVGFGANLGLSEGAVRKLLNPDHRSHIRQVQITLKALDRVLVGRATVPEAREIINTAHDEEQDYYDNMPEGIQSSEKGDLCVMEVFCLCENLLNSIGWEQGPRAVRF